MPRKLVRQLTLDAFIQHQLVRQPTMPQRAYVTQQGFSVMYVRFTRIITAAHDPQLRPVLVFARVEARNPGKGRFTILLRRLRRDFPQLHLYVEEAHERFAAYLVRIGFEPLNPNIHGNSYLLRAGRKIP